MSGHHSAAPAYDNMEKIRLQLNKGRARRPISTNGFGTGRVSWYASGHIRFKRLQSSFKRLQFKR